MSSDMTMIRWQKVILMRSRWTQRVRNRITRYRLFYLLAFKQDYCLDVEADTPQQAFFKAHKEMVSTFVYLLYLQLIGCIV